MFSLAGGLAPGVCLQPSVASHGRIRIDVPGAVTITASAAAVIYGVSVAPDDGWSSE